MHLLVEFSGEHPTLPQAELEALLAVHGFRWRPEAMTAPRVGVGLVRAADDDVTPEDLHFIVHLAMARRVSTHLFTVPADPADLEEEAQRKPLPEGVRFAVRAERVPEGPGVPKHLRAQDVERILGRTWDASARVDLERPDVTVRAVLDGDRVHVGRLLWDNDRGAFDQRAARHRPYFSPVSGHPRWMRAIVNLAQPRPGSVVYDPLCGTGGVLIEAGLVGLKPVGSDLDERMVEGSRKNLEHFGVNWSRLFVSDVKEAPGRFREETGLEHADAIVTDLPYGQSAWTGGTEPEEIGRWTLKTVAELLRPGGYAVVGAGREGVLSDPPGDLRLVDSFAHRTHKRLTRTYGVLHREK
ncbi:MAG: N-6 DNA methylase [Euryarchaeota archaeon]|nr:N-6 DNA methylase [Euryarchaeota archaeon]